MGTRRPSFPRVAGAMVACALAGSALAFAAAGRLDRTFSGDGMMVTRYVSGTSTERLCTRVGMTVVG